MKPGEASRYIISDLSCPHMRCIRFYTQACYQIELDTRLQNVILRSIKIRTLDNSDGQKIIHIINGRIKHACKNRLATERGENN